MAPHAPYTPPARHAQYDPAKITLRTNVPTRGEDETRKNLAGYYGLCSAVDENAGRLLKELDTLGLAENTIVVFTSDHGHMLGSHGLDEIDLPFEESSRIPLLIRYPRRLPANKDFDGLVSNVDYAPTLLALCGAAAPEGMQGLNLSALLAGGDGPQPESIYAEGKLGQPGEWRMIVRGLDKLVVDASLKPTHLYNLGQDPYELKNLFAEGPERRKRDELVALLRRWVFRTSDRVG